MSLLLRWPSSLTARPWVWRGSRRARSHGLSLAIMVLSCCWSNVARADARAEAKEKFHAGVALQQVEDYDAAVVAFEASLRLYPTKSALFNLANCLQAVHRYPEALAAVERLQSEYGDELDEDMRSAAELQRVELESLTAWLLVVVDHDGAQVLVDGQVRGTSPLADPIRLAVGDHTVEVVLDGFEPESATINLGSRERRTEELVLRRSVPPPAQPPAAVQPPQVAPAIDDGPAPRRANAAGWATVGVGATLLATGAVTGVWALVLDGELANACTGARCPTDRERDVQRLESLATTTDVLLGAGLVATGVGVFIGLRGRREPRAAVWLEPVASPTVVGARVRGRL